MNIARGFGEARHDKPDAPDDGVDEATIALTGDERRMHVRAYNHWVSLLKGRAYPSIEDLDPAGIADFGPHSVLLDFTKGIEDPSFPFLGRALREECSIDHSLTRISQVPARSLLSRLTDHYLQIIANRAPIGFEAEFTGTRGHATLYRGILMPFSSDDDSIDYIYGVINWKEVADAATQSSLTAELAAAVRAAPPPPPETAAVWADGPSAGEDAAQEAPPETLADHLALARDSAAALTAADGRSRAALYEALGRAHDFALATRDDAEGLEELLEDAGITAQARAPMTPIVKLVFGADHDKTRLTEFAAVLSHAERHAIPSGGLPAFVAGHAGGIKGVVAAERSARRPAKQERVAMPMAERPVLASVSLGESVEPGAVVVLVARGGADGRLEIVGAVSQGRIVEAATKALG